MSEMPKAMLEALVKDTIRILTIPPERFEKPTLITYVAAPGTGKSYFSEIIAQRLHFTILSEERLQTFLNPSPTYFSLKLENIFDLSLRVIEELFKEKINVIFDSNVAKRVDRGKIVDLVKNSDGQMVLIKINISEDLVVERLNKKNIQVVGGNRYGVILNREYYLAEKNKIEEPFGEEYVEYNSGLGQGEIERVISDVRIKMGYFKIAGEPQPD